MTVSIVTYHTDLDELRRCLDSLADHEAVERVYVVDNSRSASIESFLKSLADARIVYIASDNRGYGDGHNQAIRRAMEEESADGLHLVLNTDVSFNPSALGRLSAVMSRNPEVGLLHPRIVYPDGQRQWTARRLPTPFDLVLRRFMPAGWFPRSRRRYLLQYADTDRPLAVPYVQGSFMLMRLEVLRRTGLFDTRFFMYPEDIDLSRRIAESGSLVVAWPGETVVHDHRAASGRSLKMLGIHVANIVRYFNKWGWICDEGRRRLNRGIRPVELR